MGTTKIPKIKKALVIKKTTPMDKINLIPLSNVIITTAYIEPQTADFYIGHNYQPKFIDMQQVLAAGPRVDDVKIGDWVYIDMNVFKKHITKKGKVMVGIGGAEHVEERMVPPFFLAPGTDTAYFKMSERETMGVIPRPFELKKCYATLEEFVELQEKMEAEAFKLQEIEKKKQAAKIQASKKYSAAPAIHGANSGGRSKK